MATNKELEQLVKTLSAAVADLAGEVKKMTEKPQVKGTIDPPPMPVPVDPNAFAVPAGYRDAVNTVLNSDFGVSINPLSDRPAFEFTISVPRKYSNASEPHWKTYGGDFRPKVISFAEGLNGVRAWVERIFNNFNQDIKSAIFIDRAKVAGEVKVLVHV